MHHFDWDRLVQASSTFLDRERLFPRLNGQNILVTGGGGSIGRSLVESLSPFLPNKIIAVDQCEYGLHLLEQSLSRIDKKGQCRFILGDIAAPLFVERLFDREKPNIVFHTAAYKHVPICEDNPHVSIKNNLGSTLALLTNSVSGGVTKFIHVSSDKAVEAIGVMGATKRLSEILVAHFSRLGFKGFYSVRFGNILGSSGSLSEIVLNNITSGQPIRITDPKMARFFTSPRLVVQALMQSLLETEPTEVLIPNCHVEKSILDLVEEIHNLEKSGRPFPGIEYSGTRPGERLSEKLVGLGDEISEGNNNFTGVTLESGYFRNDPLAQVRKLLLDAEEFSPLLLDRLQSALLLTAKVKTENLKTNILKLESRLHN